MNKSILEPRFLFKTINDNFEYPEYYEAFENSVMSVWNWKEVNMSEDVMNWNMASNIDKNIISGILRAFTQSETLVGDYWATFIRETFPKPEIALMSSAFSFFEGIHATAYNHLSSTLGINESILYEGDILAQKKVEYLLTKIDSPKVKLAIFSGATEGMALFSAFSILLSFCKESRFKGLSQIISWSVKDEECVTGETEFLSKDGWKRIDEYKDGDYVAQFNPNSKEISFVQPLDYIKSKTYELYKIYRKNRYSQEVTPNHTVIDYHESTGKLRKSLATEWRKRTSYLPVSGFLKTRNITPLDRFLIALQADGHIRKNPSIREVVFSFKRERKIIRFRELSQELVNIYGFDIKEYPVNKQGKIKFRVLIPDEYLHLRTKFFDEVYTYDQIPVGFIDELKHWDGHFKESLDSIYYSTKEIRNIEFVQSVGALEGFYGHVYTQEDLRWSKPCLQYRILLKKVNTVPARDGSKEKVVLDSEINTYCFKVPTQAFLIRHNGLISITGNCHAKYGSMLFKELVKEEGITEEEISLIIEGFNSVLSNEIAFLNNVFGDIEEINGIKKTSFFEFLKTRYNSGLELLGLSPKYFLTVDHNHSEQVSSWFNLLSKGNISQDFFAFAKEGSMYISKPDFDESLIDWSVL